MTLHLYNTATRQKEKFEPLDPANVRMYVCGPTVYNYIHIGNALPMVVFDTLFRVLQTLYPKVTYARNITDIDDKIMKAAKDQGVEIDEISQRFTSKFLEDMAELNTLPPTIIPYATDHLEPMINMVQALVDRDHAYEAEGHVYFDVTSMADYGKLSGRSLEDMVEHAQSRVERVEAKRNAGDFVLWKPSTEQEPGWNSPWGRGRPGWHLECSAMIEKHLGNSIDIHGGGKDLIFPHHENELAQSQCAHGGEQYVKYWMHNGFLNIDGEKMSKSLNNFKTVRELLSVYSGEVLRFALLSSLYRSDADFSKELLEQSKSALDSLYGALKTAHVKPASLSKDTLVSSKAYQALLDDLNTPLAISELHQLAKTINKDPSNQSAVSELQEIANLLGILQKDPQAWFTLGVDEDDDARIQALVDERNQAKLDKNWGRADEIRDQLKAEGIELLDSKEGTSWRKN